MKLIQLKNTEGLEYLRPFVEIDDDVTTDQSLGWLRHRMETDPASIQILMAIDAPQEADESNGDDEAEFRLEAFTITEALPGREFVFLQQAWARKHAINTMAEIFLRILQFAQKWDRKSIRCETKRGNALCRAWNFEEHAVILRFDIPEDYSLRLLTRAGVTLKESNNEIQQRRIKRVDVMGGSEVSGEGSSELPTGEGGASAGAESGQPDRSASHPILRTEGS